MACISRRTFSARMLSGALAALSFGGCGKEPEQKQETASNEKAPRRVIDTHMHVRPYTTKPLTKLPEIAGHCLAVEADNSIHYAINMGVSGDELFGTVQEMFASYKNRIGTMYAFDWKLIASDPEFFVKAPDMLERAVGQGALGLKCFKDLGLTVRDRDGSLLKIDDERLFPVWERAGRLGVVVSFHSTDPVAFFAPWNADNERWKELELHPEWSFADRSKYPAREDVLIQRDNVIRQFPNVTFQGCHVANNSEDIDALARRFDAMPNFYADISARLGELGRHPADKGHAFFTKYQDRLMFGTDHYFGADGDVQGAGPQRAFTKEEDRIFYDTHWRYLETNDRQFDHPTPIQGDWKIDGIGLDSAVLEKVYWSNAYKLYKLDRFGIA